WLNSRRESAWIAMLSLFTAGVLMACIAATRSYPLAVGLAAAAGFFGNVAMICVSTLTQSPTPDYIRGRVFGARELLPTISQVTVHLIIWRLPAADQWMVPALYATAGLLAFISLIG